MNACVSCGRPASDRHFLPTYEGLVVSNRPLFAVYMPSCVGCHELHRLGLISTSEEITERVPSVTLTDGDGI